MLPSCLLGSSRQERTEGKWRRPVGDSALLAGKSKHGAAFSEDHAESARSFISPRIVNIVNRTFCSLISFQKGFGNTKFLF